MAKDRYLITKTVEIEPKITVNMSFIVLDQCKVNCVLNFKANAINVNPKIHLQRTLKPYTHVLRLLIDAMIKIHACQRNKQFTKDLEHNDFPVRKKKKRFKP